MMRVSNPVALRTSDEVSAAVAASAAVSGSSNVKHRLSLTKSGNVVYILHTSSRWAYLESDEDGEVVLTLADYADLTRDVEACVLQPRQVPAQLPRVIDFLEGRS